MKGLSRIKEYSFHEIKEEQVVCVTLSTEGEEDIREELFYWLAEAKMPIMELTVVEKSLEDVFLELTEEEAGEETVEETVEETANNEEEKQDESDI